VGRQRKYEFDLFSVIFPKLAPLKRGAVIVLRGKIASYLFGHRIEHCLPVLLEICKLFGLDSPKKSADS
jgi:hypothetical protein